MSQNIEMKFIKSLNELRVPRAVEKMLGFQIGDAAVFYQNDAGEICIKKASL